MPGSLNANFLTRDRNNLPLRRRAIRLAAESQRRVIDPCGRRWKAAFRGPIQEATAIIRKVIGSGIFRPSRRSQQSVELRRALAA